MWTYGTVALAGSQRVLEECISSTFLSRHANGCTARDCIFIDEEDCCPNGLAVNAVAMNTHCGQCDGSVWGNNVTGGSPPYYYYWENDFEQSWDNPNLVLFVQVNIVSLLQILKDALLRIVLLFMRMIAVQTVWK